MSIPFLSLSLSLYLRSLRCDDEREKANDWLHVVHINRDATTSSDIIQLISTSLLLSSSSSTALTDHEIVHCILLNIIHFDHLGCASNKCSQTGFRLEN